MQQHTHKLPFVHLAYRKIMIDYLPLCDLSRTVKAAAVVPGTPVRVFYSGMARVPWRMARTQGRAARQAALLSPAGR